MTRGGREVAGLRGGQRREGSCSALFSSRVCASGAHCKSLGHKAGVGLG